MLFTGLPFGEYTITEYMSDTGDAVGNINSMTFVAEISKTTDTVTVDQAYTPAVEDDPATGDVNEAVDAAGEAAQSTLVNAYVRGVYCIAVTKQWLVNGKVSVPDDNTELTVRLERSVDGENWGPALKKY